MGNIYLIIHEYEYRDTETNGIGTEEEVIGAFPNKEDAEAYVERWKKKYDKAFCVYGGDWLDCCRLRVKELELMDMETDPFAEVVEASRDDSFGDRIYLSPDEWAVEQGYCEDDGE